MRPPHAGVVLAVVLITSGCLGVFGPSRPPSDERAVDALERSQTAMAEVTSYRTDAEGRVEATDDDESITLTVTGTVTTNVSTQRMNATATVRQHGGPGNRERTQMTYLDGYTAYTECARFGWGRENHSAQRSWLAYTPAGQQLALLNETDVYWRGTEQVDGEETAVITAHPTAEELQSKPSVRESDPTTVDSGTVENATVTVWINTETDRPVKARNEIRISKGGNTATASVTFRFSDYDESTSVTRPRFEEESVRKLGCPGS